MTLYGSTIVYCNNFVHKTKNKTYGNKCKFAYNFAYIIKLTYKRIFLLSLILNGNSILTFRITFFMNWTYLPIKYVYCIIIYVPANVYAKTKLFCTIVRGKKNVCVFLECMCFWAFSFCGFAYWLVLFLFFIILFVDWYVLHTHVVWF